MWLFSRINNGVTDWEFYNCIWFLPTGCRPSFISLVGGKQDCRRNLSAIVPGRLLYMPRASFLAGWLLSRSSSPFLPPSLPPVLQFWMKVWKLGKTSNYWLKKYLEPRKVFCQITTANFMRWKSPFILSDSEISRRCVSLIPGVRVCAHDEVCIWIGWPDFKSYLNSDCFLHLLNNIW